MKSNLIDKVVINEDQIIYSLDPQNKQSIIKHQSNGIITELNYYQGVQTIQKKKYIKQADKQMNINVKLDIMSMISNLINNKETNLKMCYIVAKDQQSNKLFQLVYCITFSYGYQIQEKEIDEAILDISDQIDLIFQNVYRNGDNQMAFQIDQLMDKYFDVLN